jgi:hypothetical protein
MHGLPSDFDGLSFVNQILDEITFTVNTVHLAFSPNFLLTILSTYSYRLTADDARHTEHLPVTATAVLGLIGRQVINISVAENKNLIFEFEGNGEFICIDDSDQYESYTIKVGDREIFV